MIYSGLILTKVFKNKVEWSGLDTVDDNAYNDSFSIERTVSVTPDMVLKTRYMTFDDRTVFDTDHADKQDVKDIDYGLVVTNTLIKLAVEYAWMEPSLSRVEGYESFMATITLPF